MLARGCGNYLGASCFLMVQGTLYHGWSFLFLVSSGKTLHSTAGGRQHLFGCTDNFVMHVGGLQATQTLEGVPIYCKFGFGKGFQ